MAAVQSAMRDTNLLRSIRGGSRYEKPNVRRRRLDYELGNRIFNRGMQEQIHFAQQLRVVESLKDPLTPLAAAVATKCTVQTDKDAARSLASNFGRGPDAASPADPAPSRLVRREAATRAGTGAFRPTAGGRAGPPAVPAARHASASATGAGGSRGDDGGHDAAGSDATAAAAAADGRARDEPPVRLSGPTIAAVAFGGPQ